MPPLPAWVQRLPLSREGRFWSFIALAMLVTGLLKSINLMTLLACFLLTMVGLNFLLARRQLARLHVRRADPEPAFADTPWRFAVVVRNDGPRDAQGVRIQAGPQKWFLPTLPAGAAVTVQAEIVFPRRGRVTAEPLQIVSGYPLGLAQVARPADDGEGMIVLPRLGTLQRGALHAYLHFQGLYDGRAPQPAAPAASAQMLFHGLRSYRPGDSLRAIHWRTSARRNELMVREFEDPPGDDLVVVVDASRPATAAGTDDLERVITLAATVCWEWCRQTGDRLVLAVAGAEVMVRAGITGRPLALQLLEILALEPGTAAVDPTTVAERLREHALPAGPVLVLGGRHSSLADGLRAALPRPVVGLTAGSEKEGKLFQI